MNIQYVLGMIRVEQDSNPHLHGVFVELIPLCGSLLLFVYVYVTCLFPNNVWWKYCTGQNKYKALWNPRWDHPLHWCKLINQQFLLFTMTQLYQNRVLISPCSPLELHELVKYLGKIKIPCQHAFILSVISGMFSKREVLNWANGWVWFWEETIRGPYLLSIYYVR